MAEHTPYQDITIEDVDYSIHEWFNIIVDCYADSPAEGRRKVPVLFAAGERWATGREEEGIRDKNGVLILPLISVRRIGFERNLMMSSLGTETENFVITRRIDKKSNVVQNAISSRDISARRQKGKAVYEITTIPFPDRSVTNYEVVIQAQYISQMNEILQKIVHNFKLQNQILMPLSFSRIEHMDTSLSFEERKKLNGYYFVGFIEQDLSDTGNFEEFTDQERIIRYRFNVMVPTYLQLDPDGMRPAIQTETTAFDVRFSDENVCFVEDEDEWDIIFGIKKP